MLPVTWVLEAAAFPPSYSTFVDAVRRAGQTVIPWRDAWWNDASWPRVSEGPALFHGSLENAARVATTLPWRPGAYCNTDAFRCSRWYPRAREWLLHREWHVVSARDLVASPAAALVSIHAGEALFVRPDSPLKPFAGRVLRRDGITLRALDHGFYYEDDELPVVVAPVRSITAEWRYVIVDLRVVGGCRYQAEGRTALGDDPSGAPWRFAASVAASLAPPEEVYVLDVCEADGQLWLLELNPFSGADLYGCDADAIVAAVSSVAERAYGGP